MEGGNGRTVLITAMGTRGDVQPFVALGLHLARQRGWRVVLAVPPEYRAFVQGYGLEAEDIGISLQHAMHASPQGRALRSAGMLTAFQATRDFFRLPLLESWFECVRRLLARLRPDVLLLSGFVAMSGAGALPELLGLPTRVALAYTVPMAPTAEFGMPLAGTGFTAPVPWLNRLQWDATRTAVSVPLHKRRAQGIVDAASATAAASCGGSPGGSSSPGGSLPDSGCPRPASPLGGASPRIQLGSQLTPGPVPTLYIYSSALLPKPADWPAGSHVVGPLLLRRGQSAAGGQPCGGAAEAGLPADLQAYLDAAARAQLPVLYIGLGSMLGTVFEPDEVQRLVGCMQAAVETVHTDTPLAAVIHSTLQPGSRDGERLGECEGQAAERRHGQALPPHFALRAPVAHDLLLPQCDLIVHHGGAGTVQAALVAGKPSLVVPCVPCSDQPFWADLLYRRGLGPQWFPVRSLTAERLARGIREGLAGLRSYTAEAEGLAVRMAGEDGVAAAAALIERLAVEG